MDLLKKPVFEALDRMGIAYDVYEHPPVFTSEDAETHWRDIAGRPVKNLFLRNKKGDREYLVILGIEKRADLKQLVRVIGDDRLSFGSAERLMTTMGLTPGSVSPFGLIHAGSRAVRVIVDADLRGANRLIFHPNINTASVAISFADLETFVTDRGNTVRYINL
ncbi:MAG TPA: prolyl-tRNA synthetase associated domain-containing protein [Vicinamibacterales bacterium]|nr:prolyl-tRNA synthetase associated domain-containing protein [Vicinamibacterales bacterium]